MIFEESVGKWAENKPERWGSGLFVGIMNFLANQSMVQSFP